jgi:alpha-beta hydrolase superfamily lysophospholipase
MAQISSSSEEKPTIVVVQGSFQTTLVYEALEKGLQSQGYPTIHPALPSCSNVDSPTFPSITLLDDAIAVRREVSRVVEENRTVVLVMHSYGGLVGSEAITEEMSYSSRQSRNLKGGVIHLFMFSAFLVEEGKSVLDAFGVSPNDDIKVRILL